MADVMELIKQHEADMIGIRRHIHANPELSNEENRTTALIREKLENTGSRSWSRPEDRRGRFPEGRKTRENRCDPGGHRRPAHV